MEDISQYVVYEDQTVLQVIATIKKCKARCVVVLNSMDKVTGVISQGDILTALMAHVNLYAPIEQVLNRSFIYFTEKDVKKATQIFYDKGLSMIPILNHDNQLVDVITMKEIIDFLRDQ